MVENLPAMQKTQVWSLGQEDPLKEGMATQSSILAWRIPWTEEPSGLLSKWRRNRWLLLGEQSNNSKDNKSIVKTASSNTFLNCFAKFDLAWPLNHLLHWKLTDDDVDLIWSFQLLSTKAWTLVSLCLNSWLNSPLFSSFYEYAYTAPTP